MRGALIPHNWKPNFAKAKLLNQEPHEFIRGSMSVKQMKITCYSCNKPMTSLGAILFSPPFKTNSEMSVATVHKYHVCVDCWHLLFKHIESLNEPKVKK